MPLEQKLQEPTTRRDFLRRVISFGVGLLGLGFSATSLSGCQTSKVETAEPPKPKNEYIETANRIWNPYGYNFGLINKKDLEEFPPIPQDIRASLEEIAFAYQRVNFPLAYFGLNLSLIGEMSVYNYYLKYNLADDQRPKRLELIRQLPNLIDGLKDFSLTISFYGDSDYLKEPEPGKSLGSGHLHTLLTYVLWMMNWNIHEIAKDRSVEPMFLDFKMDAHYQKEVYLDGRNIGKYTIRDITFSSISFSNIPTPSPVHLTFAQK